MAVEPHYKTRTYYAWASMKTRCNNPKSYKYSDYGGRGIAVCDRWKDYDNFLEDMGEKPEKTSLGRIDNNLNYSPDNCRWETDVQQANNKRNNCLLTYNGKSLTIPQWARELNIKRSTLSMRYYSFGWDIERCLVTPVRSRKRG